MAVLTGRHAIRAALEEGVTGSLFLLRKDEQNTSLAQVADKEGVAVRWVTAEKIRRLGGPAARGAVLVTEGGSSAVPSIDLRQWLASCTGQLPSPIIALDHVTDPHNLGAILRSTHWFGAPLVIIPMRRSATGGDVVARSSAGAVTYQQIAYVSNLRSSLEMCKKRGYWIYGADAGGQLIPEARINTPTLLILGSEGAGISPGLEKIIDGTLAIPAYKKKESTVDSLNVSVSTGVFLYELRRRTQ